MSVIAAGTTIRWRSMAGVGLALLLVYGVLNVVSAIAVPIALEMRAVKGLGDGAVLLGNGPEEHMLGTTYAQLHRDNPKLDKLLVDTMLGMCAQMMAMATAFLGVAWFAARRGARWAPWVLLVSGVVWVPYYFVIASDFAAFGAVGAYKAAAMVAVFAVPAVVGALLMLIAPDYSRAATRRLVLLLGVLALPAGARAQSVWQPAPDHTQMAIWPSSAPNAKAVTAAEALTPENKELVAGKPWMYVSNVSQPTLTVYSPSGANTGAAVVVFPGGGYQILAIDLEGTEACDWLMSRGITCVLLKYRVPCATSGRYRDCLTALQDAQRAMGLVRFHAAEWHIDPHKIGVLGFSAGGRMVTAISTRFEQRAYARVDAADDESCRPDFAIALYPGHIAAATRQFALNPDIVVTRRTPPTFLLQAEDDPVDPVENSIVYHAALRKAGVPVELHLYAKGGHAFGLRRTSNPITHWPDLVEEWLRVIGVLGH